VRQRLPEERGKNCAGISCLNRRTFDLHDPGIERRDSSQSLADSRRRGDDCPIVVELAHREEALLEIEPHALDRRSGEASLVQSTFKAVDAVRTAMKIESTVRYLGIEVDDAIGIA
jgi:hypothetical protein